MHLSTEDGIRLVRTAGRLEITLDRAGKANALNAAMMRALAAAIGAAQADEAVVLRSASPTVFCAGADIREFVAGALPEQEAALLALIGAMANSAAPIIALASGKASGAGVIMLTLADVVIGSGSLQLAAPEFRFGMYPVIVEAVLQSRLSDALASRLCLGAGSLEAELACGLGLVTEVLPVDGFDRQAGARLDSYLERMAGLRTLRASRRTSAATRELLARLPALGALMLQNFDAPGIRERVAGYVEGLGRR